jgi:peroxiredoxin
MDGLLLVLLLVLVGLVLASQIGLWIVQYQVVKQQGRLLLRLDELGGSSAPAIGVAGEASAPLGAPDGVATPTGLAVGTSLNPFSLPDLDGRPVELPGPNGKGLLLVHWNPSCGFCAQIAPDLARSAADLARHGVELVLVSFGTAEANRRFAQEYGLRCAILLREALPSVAVFDGLGTPVGYLLDREGRVAEPLAIGAPAVLELLRLATGRPARRLPGERPLSESRIERTGLKAGAPAPAFTLPEIHGGTVSLDRYRGQRVLLVFTDPHCGPCEALAPKLAQLHRDMRRGGLELVAIGRGSVEENRRSAEQHGIEFRVAVQRRWEISRAYGIFATPVGFLVDERGILASDVAQGEDAIIALAQGASEPPGKDRLHERLIR